MPDLFWWCESCGRVPILAEVAQFGVGYSPYICPGCATVEGDKITVPPDKNKLMPYAQARKQHPDFPEVPTRGHTY